jgi:hypothetical protein
MALCCFASAFVIFLHAVFCFEIPIAVSADEASGHSSPHNENLVWNKNTRYLALVNYYDHDVSWARKLNHPHIIYYKNRTDKEPFSAANKAKDEINLMKFIADFYDNLPMNLIFLHQYEIKPFSHDGSVVDIINHPQFEARYNASKSVGFWSINRPRMESVWHHVDWMLESGWWPTCMEPYFGPIRDVGDFLLGKTCCSQFVVSRQRIHSLPREFYRNSYDWLVSRPALENSSIELFKRMPFDSISTRL